MSTVIIYLLLIFIDRSHCLVLNDRTTSTTIDPQAPKAPPELQSLLPITGKDLKATLKRALEIIEDPNTYVNHINKRPARGPNYDDRARALLRALTQDPNFGEPIAENLPPPVAPSQPDDPEFCLPSTSFGSGRRTSLKTMSRIVEMVDKGLSEKSIKVQYKWYNRQYLADFRKCVEEGGSRKTKKEQINKRVLEEVKNTLNNRLPLKGYMLRALGRRAAIEFGAPWFKASRGWMDYFKAQNKIVSRKVTKTCSRPQIDRAPQIEASKIAFLAKYSRASRYFHPRYIWNIDQTGVEYESSNARSLNFRGTRDVWLRVDSFNKNSHSYTAQPILTRDGRLVGKLALVMQEAANEFGPRVGQAVEELERAYGNVRVYASKSGKMDSRLISRWLQDVAEPTLRQHQGRASSGPPLTSGRYQTDDDDQACINMINQSVQNSDCEMRVPSVFNPFASRPCPPDKKKEMIALCKNPAFLLLADAWGGHSGDMIHMETRFAGGKPLTIPAHTTGQLQPLDVGFFLQLKKFIRRITEEALVQGRVDEIISRAGIINLMSLIYNQLQSPAYHDLWRNAWRHTDPNFDPEKELTNTPPANVNSIQFGFDAAESCSVEDCQERIVVRCSHCGRPLCLTHFLNRTCFHEVDEENDMVAMGVVFGPGVPDEDELEEDEEELLLMDVPPIRQDIPSTTTTRDPAYQQLDEMIHGTCAC